MQIAGDLKVYALADPDERSAMRSSRPRALALFVFAAVSIILSQAAFSGSVWIALRSDGRTGTGSEVDPFDGKMAERLDALLQSVEPGTTIHFDTGTFVTRGISAKDGWRIRGRGKDITTLRLKDGAAVVGGQENTSVIAKYFDGVWLNYFEMSNLTLDCNRENQPVFVENKRGFALNAYLIAAKSARITHVRVRGTWANPGEGFPCMVMHDGSRNGDRIEISGVEVLNPIGYLTAISVTDQSGGSVSGFIRHCLVTQHKDGSAFGSGGWRDFEVSRNVTEDVAIPIVIDTHDYRNVRIHSNHFYGCTFGGILANGGGVYEGIRIFRNFFEMGPKAGPCINAGNTAITGEVRANTIVQTGVKEQVIARGPASRMIERENVIRRAGKARQPRR